MKVFVATSLFFIAQCAAFAPAFRPRPTTTVHDKAGGVADELGIPCEDECAIEKFPNLPASVHPGVLSGKPMMDLLNHAKENGKNLASERGGAKDGRSEKA